MLGHLGTAVIVILNDNEMSIAPPTGAMSPICRGSTPARRFQEFKAAAKGAVSCCPNRSRKGRGGRRNSC
jgi:1-deoxy-D-xylulose-5-phosphate synthase